MISKISSYLGFAVKSRKILYGIGMIADYRKKIHLLVLCDSASDNTKKQAEDLASYRALKIVRLNCEYKLESLVNKTNCKLVAVTDSNLAKAILSNGSDCFCEIV